MNLTDNEKEIMISILKTLSFNNIDDLKTKLINNKDLLSKEKYDLLLFGNENYFTDKNVQESNKIRTIKELDGRWCLTSILLYHIEKTKKVSYKQYNEIMCI